jgi:large subunit ribosomal protein L35e
LLEELATQEKKLFELRGQIATSASAQKQSEIKNVRKDVARIKTVLMEQQRKALIAKYESAKLIPKDLRPHTTKSQRKELPEKYANKQVKKAAGKKKYYYNSKTKKWQSKKIKGAKTKKMVNKDKKIILYCGFVGCARSHQAAMYLKKKGFTNVYRYPGGISAWVDANLPIAGTDVQ